MKKISLVLLLSLFVIGGLVAQKTKVTEKDVPQNVINDTKAKNTNAFPVTWSKDAKQNLWIASIDNPNSPVNFVYKAEAYQKKTWNVDLQYTPHLIKQHVDSAYAQYKIVAVQMVEYSTSSEKFYEVQIAKKKNVKTIVYALNSTFVREEVPAQEEKPAKDAVKK